jgi:pumilio homology domain family member 6
MLSLPCRKEKKELIKQRKERRNKNFNLIEELVSLWEVLRRHDTTAQRRSELVSVILKKMKGHIAELAGNHTASRVVQACVKHGTATERSAILKEVEPRLLELAKGSYGHFVVSKLIDAASKEELNGT